MSAAFDKDWHIRTDNSLGDCPECLGTGEDSAPRFPWQTVDCDYCKGTGRVWSAEDEQASIADALNDEFVIERTNA